nr:glycosyltransferase family 4 protein [Candidatus Eremiobacteraeota bacterium]
AAQQGVASHVFFLGDVDDAEVRAAYARAWCFALPTRRVGVGDVEGFGIVYLEAAMASLPAVGGRNSGAEDAIEDNESGLLVDGDNPAEIAEAVGFLLQDRARAAGMGQYACARALREFSWRIAAANILEAIGSKTASEPCYA